MKKSLFSKYFFHFIRVGLGEGSSILKGSQVQSKDRGSVSSPEFQIQERERLRNLCERNWPVGFLHSFTRAGGEMVRPLGPPRPVSELLVLRGVAHRKGQGASPRLEACWGKGGRIPSRSYHSGRPPAVSLKRAPDPQPRLRPLLPRRGHGLRPG